MNGDDQPGKGAPPSLTVGRKGRYHPKGREDIPCLPGARNGSGIPDRPLPSPPVTPRSLK
jgi:hypothetical protein